LQVYHFGSANDLTPAETPYDRQYVLLCLVEYCRSFSVVMITGVNQIGHVYDLCDCVSSTLDVMLFILCSLFLKYYFDSLSTVI